MHLCKLRDPETQRLSLQTLELLAIENSDVIIQHVNDCFHTTCIYSPNSVYPKEGTLGRWIDYFFNLTLKFQIYDLFGSIKGLNKSNQGDSTLLNPCVGLSR